MPKTYTHDLFISHSSKDDDFVRALQQALAFHNLHAWIDSRELLPGGLLNPDITKAINESSAYAVVVSPAALKSKWVGKELSHALKVQTGRGKAHYPVIALSLDGTKLGVLEAFFDDEPIYIPVSSQAGGVEAALHAMLVGLRKRLPSDVAATPQPKVEALEELVLQLSDLKIHEHDGVRRAQAKAKLVYEPATPGQREVASEKTWRFTAPIGPIEAEELRWYLEKYAVWPSAYFRERARKVEQNLLVWGQQLYQEALPIECTANVLQAWARVNGTANRRFSILVESTTEAGALDAEVNSAREAATLLLGLPWELLHDGGGYLFQGAKPTRVRRRLPNTQVLDVPVVATPIRILLITARPEDEACGYIDHRASALPLVEAMEKLGGLVQIHLLNPPTLPALRTELDRTLHNKQPYHVVHFDGHGVYDRSVGLGGLCFEDPTDHSTLGRRRHTTVYTNELGPLLRDHRIPLVFLEACQTAQAEKASESVASELLKVGVASVVAMSHSVLVETARRFVEAFYAALAAGQRVGAAMLAGQRQLKDDNFRGNIFGAGELRLEDWFVPVLFQEKDDPQLFRETPSQQTRADYQTMLKARLGELPEPPQSGFIGRSRELLVLQRLLHQESYAVVRGQGGEGKTALAAEFARWMVRSQQIKRAVFVSVEGIEKNIVEQVLDQIGNQLVKKSFSTQIDCGGNLNKAEMEIERTLREHSTLLVVDNMENILLPPFITAPQLLSEEAQRELTAILDLCARLNRIGQSRILFTSREALPAPFDGQRQRIELHQLARDDAVKLVERVLNEDGQVAGSAADAATEVIEELVEAVHCHARTLALLAPALRSRGVNHTRAALVELMTEMERTFPGSREQSLFASLELSLRRLSPDNRERVKVLGVFHGGVDLDVLRIMMEWEETDVATLADELLATGLATANPYNHLALNPALCPYLRGRLEGAELEALTARWSEAMGRYAGDLDQQRHKNAQLAATLTQLELPNLFALLEWVQRSGDAEKTIALTTTLYGLLQNLGKPRLLERLGAMRDRAAAVLGETWNHAQFQAQRTRIEQQLGGGQWPQAHEGAQVLLQRARTAGDQAYPGADYDLAMACWLRARVLRLAGRAEQALPLLDEARQYFEAIASERAREAAKKMASACITEGADCLRALGRYDDAATAYEEAIRRDEQRGDERSVTVGKGELGTVRLLQRRYPEALAAYEQARDAFTRLKEPGSGANAWHQIGMVYQEMVSPEAAEDAYRQSLAIEVRLAEQAATLVQLGNLYAAVLVRREDAVDFYRQAMDKYVEVHDYANEGVTRSNLADTLCKLRRFGEARQEIRRAIECKAPFGHTSEPWTSWHVLASIETGCGNPDAAAEAKQQATTAYLAHRRDGGENQNPAGRIALAVTHALLSDGPAAAAALLQQAPDFAGAGFPSFTPALHAIVNGSRDRHLAAAPDLDYLMAAEILLLIETLEREI